MCPNDSQTTSEWERDKLGGRKGSADFLTRYLTARYAEHKSNDEAGSFVLSINADWGFGKTFFLKNWKADLANLGHPCVYFDAWANDFTGEPLVGFISELDSGLKPRLPQQARKLLSKAVTNARRMVKPAAAVALEILLKRLTLLSGQELRAFLSTSGNETVAGDQDTDSAEKEIATILSESAKAALNEHNDKKAAIAACKNNLSKLVERLSTEPGVKLPIFVFIDELDRSRPTYAIELLESIKHIFGTNGVYFIVATNRVQLSHSVRTLYGAEFDSDGYLRRFFDQEYRLPPPDCDKYANYLFDRFELNKQNNFYTGLTTAIYGGQNLSAKVFSILSQFFKLGLRDQEQLAGALKAVILAWPSQYRTIHLVYLLFLLGLKQKSTEAYDKFVSMLPTFKQAELVQLIQACADRNTVIEGIRTGEDLRDRNRRIPVKLLDICVMYAENTFTDLKALRDRQLNNIDFPDCLIAKVAEEMPSTYRPGNSYVPSIRYYPELVSHAGQLISKF